MAGTRRSGAAQDDSNYYVVALERTLPQIPYFDEKERLRDTIVYWGTMSRRRSDALVGR